MSDPADVAVLQSQLDSLRSEATRQQLESEQALHDLALKVQQLEEELTTAHQDTQNAQAQVQEERTKREDAERKVTEGEQAKRDGGERDGELRRQLDQAEREKRDLLEVVEKEKREREGVEESLTKVRQEHTTLLTAHSELEATLASTTATSRTSLLRIQTLESTITSLNADKAFLTAELERGRAEWSTYRSEKHAELVRLQSELDSRSVEAQSAQSSLATLKKAHATLKSRHEETLGELASLKETSAKNEHAFATEMSSMRRLVELMETREEERKQRIDEVEKALEEERASLAEREEEMRDQLLGERERADALEARNAELREALERGVPASGSVAPDSPASANGSAFALSPSAMRAAAGQKPGQGRSYAEVYKEYIRMEDELAKERAETKRLGECLEQILAEINERAPLLQEQRVEYERLTVEATSLASQLASALSDRDASARTSESLRLDLTRVTNENTILSQQLSDLGRQVRTLTRVLAAQANPSLGDPNDPHFDEEEAAILRRAETVGDTDAVVSAHLVTFTTLNELQAQNQKLLQITRTMGAQLEKGEEDARARVRGEENEAIREAHDLVLRLKQEVEAQRERVAVGEKEREMLRRLVAQRGGAVPASSAAAVGGAAIVEGADADAARLLADVQTAFEAYKAETGTDMARLRDDLQQAQREAGEVRTELAKEKARGEFTAERFRLLTESYELQQSELSQASKRALELQGTIAKLDMTEDLLALRTSTSTLQHENTTLRSEREVLKVVEKRLVDENASLAAERARMAELMRGLQGMQNELERTGGEQRRRLEESVQRLEAQAAELKEKLNQAEDSNRQLALRKEIDGRTFQDRIDKLTAEHSSTREELVAAKTSQEHLEQRVRDLVLQVEAKEEKLAVYEGRTGTGEGDPTRSAEEQLQVTVADLRNELRTVKAELERAKEHVAQYQAIAETQGESLREVTAVYEEYKSSTDAAIAEKDSEISSLRERLHSLTTDLTTSNTQNSELHRQIEAERAAFEQERKTFEDGLVSLRSADAAAREAQLAAQEDMRRQAQIAKDAHDKYERELVAHAEDVKRLSEVKEELETVRATVREHQSAAEVARANLAQSEESWQRQKSVLEAELSEIRKRSDELKEQNSTLAQHLETASAQATQLQARHTAITDAAGAAGEAADADTIEAITASHNSSVEQLREVIRYLRREKDIIDLQLDFSKQEAARLRQQLEFTSRGLEEARQSLQEERQKAGDSLTSSAQHAELLESIHTAKLLRESNQTLRDENEANLRKVATLDSQVRSLQAELAPLREELRMVKAEVESKQHNIKLLEEDNERWKTRNQTILAKYERIDPEELQVLKNEVEKVQAQLAAVEEEKVKLNEQLEEKSKLADSMRSNWQNGLERFKALQTQARSTRDERNALTKTVEELKEQLANAGGSEAVAAAAAQAQTDSQEAIAQLEARLAAAEKEKADVDARLLQQQTEQTEQAAALEELKAKLTTLETEKAEAVAHRDRLAAREAPIFRDNRRMLDEAKTRQAELVAARGELEKLKTSVASGDNAAAIEAAVQARLAEAAPAPAPAAPTDEQIAEAAKEKVAAAEAQFASQRDEAIANAVKSTSEQFEKDLAALRAELEAAKAAPPPPPAADGSTTPSPGASDEDVKKAVEAAVEAAKKEMEDNFAKVRETMAAESTKREKEITERMTAALRKAQQQASAAAAAPTSAPPPDVEGLVKEKLAELEKERAAAQQQAVEKAVADALDKQKEAHDKLLIETKDQIEKQAVMKHTLLQKTVAGLRKKLEEAGVGAGAKPAAAPAVASPTAASAPAPASAGLPAKPSNAKAAANGGAASPAAAAQPAAATTEGGASPTAGRGGAAGGRGRGAGRGARGGARGGAAGRGGKAAASPPATSPAAAAVTPAQAAGVPSIAVRGNAKNGGVLGALLGQGGAGLAGGQQGGKRARESDGDGGAEKRPKGA
ncbi:Protein mlp1 [Rhodosporidiobolus nylandii]